MKGIVLKSTGSWYSVKTTENSIINCRLKGKFRQGKILFTNPVAVGDQIRLSIEKDQETGVIEEILPRKNYVVRASTRKKHTQHILAANIDQALLIVTYKNPKIKLGFIDRFLLACEAYHIPAGIIFNKSDLIKGEDSEMISIYRDIYETIGYKTYLISAQQQKGLKEIEDLFLNRVSLVSGHSGVGKSTLINYLIPGLDLKVSPLSDYSGKGIHTTTFACMYEIPEGGMIIDTPGIKELSVVDIKPEEISHYFPEMKERLPDCQFNNCLHVDEPGCAVKVAVEKGEIAFNRFENYLHILYDIKEAQTW